MKPTFRRILPALIFLAALLIAGAGYVLWQAPDMAANLLLYPRRKAMAASVRDAYPSVTFTSDGLTLQGWRIPAAGSPRGTLVYLHGVGDNRASAAGPAKHFSNLGLDVIAYDARAHGESGGDVCTYGYYEKRDLARVLDTIQVHPIVVMGLSLGGSIALQAAADDPRIAAVIAAESFSDLRTVAIQRAPWYLWSDMIRRAFLRAEVRGHFVVDEISPMAAARRVTVPVFLVHGAADDETPPDHSQRIFDALAGPKQLLLVDGVGHDRSLTDATWKAIDVWFEDVLPKITK